MGCERRKGILHRRIRRVFGLITGVVVLAPCASFAQTEYPCPSDPGFCYRDFADDGCFDAGVDEGPINDEILSYVIPYPSDPAGRPAGSIICPPSVEKLQSENRIEIATPIGSSIRFYGRTKISPSVYFLSGGDILLQGDLFGWGNVVLQAEGDVLLEANVRDGGKGFGNASVGICGYTYFPDGVINPGWSRRNPYVRAESLAGDVVVGPKNRFKTGKVDLLAHAGSVTILEKVKSSTFCDFRVGAPGGLSVHDGLKLKKGLFAGLGEGVGNDLGPVGSFSSVGRLQLYQLGLNVGDGDVSIESLQGQASAWIKGHNVSIGTPPRMKGVYTGRLDIDATGDIEIVGFSHRSPYASARITTTGTSIKLLASKIINPEFFYSGSDQPRYEITAGPGSTCDLTGTTFKKNPPAINCDTVIGP